MSIIMNGNEVASKIKKEIADITKEMVSKPGLAVIMVGDDPASNVYVKAKRKDCKECGFKTFDYSLGIGTTEEAILSLIDLLNDTGYVDGILVQLPLPNYINTERIISSIKPWKDVDGLHKINMGGVLLGRESIIPCTPAGIMKLLEEYKIDVDGKKCVIVNKSNTIGKPLSMLLTNKNATVTICHSHTKNTMQEIAAADIVITATGGGLRITADDIKEGAVVIDASTFYNEAGVLSGDVVMDDAIHEKASYITPVPGGVGPMTRAMLMYNTLYAAINYNHKK